MHSLMVTLVKYKLMPLQAAIFMLLVIATAAKLLQQK